jgi:hypothetical protein
MQLIYWPLVEVALLLIGQTYISFDKPYFTARVIEEYTQFQCTA